MKMATTASAKCTGEIEQNCQSRSADMFKTRTPSQLLTLEEARCPICSKILLEPVTMPCSHSVCLHCFKRTVEFTSLCCPLCRLRVSSWARKQSREKSLVNTELWDMVRKSYPERCKSRMEQRDWETQREEIFRPPVQISRSGDLRPEQQKVTMNEEKVEGRRKVHHRREESGTLKHFQDPFSGVLSDSENEEPVGKRTRNVSAFVRKTKTLTKDSLSNNVVQRSQSCTDSVEGGGKVKAPQLFTLDKASISHSYNAGILLSSENSRSLSAPIIVPEKRHSWRSVMATTTSLMGPQSKQERSISPESNDSISEELNHFKPIVCSPCTPPKRLPDGRVMEPTIVKSTPRNLTRSFQRPTSYEASPSILQKWKQIELDRQCIEMTSKGTLTSPFNEEIIIKQSPTEERESKSCACACASAKGKEHCGVCTIRTDTCGQENEKVFVLNKRRLIFDQPIGETTINQKQPITFNCPSLPHNSGGPARECVSFHETEVAPESSCGLTPSHKNAPLDRSTAVRYCKVKLRSSKDQRKELENRNCGQNHPTSRRGRKRSQKTKHLEETELRLKKSRPQSPDSFNMDCGESDLCIQQVQQESEDRELALKLQRQFDMEQKRVDEKRKSPDKYFLRSWFPQENRRKYNPRRSSRIIKKNEHLKCNH